MTRSCREREGGQPHSEFGPLFHDLDPDPDPDSDPDPKNVDVDVDVDVNFYIFNLTFGKKVIRTLRSIKIPFSKWLALPIATFPFKAGTVSG